MLKYTLNQNDASPEGEFILHDCVPPALIRSDRDVIPFRKDDQDRIIVKLGHAFLHAVDIDEIEIYVFSKTDLGDYTDVTAIKDLLAWHLTGDVNQTVESLINKIKES